MNEKRYRGFTVFSDVGQVSVIVLKNLRTARANVDAVRTSRLTEANWRDRMVADLNHVVVGNENLVFVDRFAVSHGHEKDADAPVDCVVTLHQDAVVTVHGRDVSGGLDAADDDLLISVDFNGVRTFLLIRDGCAVVNDGKATPPAEITGKLFTNKNIVLVGQ